MRVLDRLFHVPHDRFFVIGDHHGAPTQHVTGPHQHGRSDGPRCFARPFDGGCRSVGGRWNLQVVQQFAEALAIFRQINRFGRGADDVDSGSLERQRKIQRSLSAELHDHALRLFALHDRQHIFKRQRL
jgi:hypothetical protein